MIEGFIPYIKQFIPTVKTIFDIGSRDGLQSVEFAKAFPDACVYAFEANPASFQKCLENTKNHKQITCIEAAIHEYDGTCKFFPIDTAKTVTTHADGNPGASSLFRAIPGVYDHIEKYVQYEIEQKAMRLDTFAKASSIDSVDIIWMDLQGAELLALKGMGTLLDTVKIIHTEIEMNPIYQGQCLFKDVDPFLQSKGFRYLAGSKDQYFGTDLIYVK